eukprot:4723334-Lingulodinium_polyedra.AAC.1
MVVASKEPAIDLDELSRAFGAPMPSGPAYQPADVVSVPSSPDAPPDSPTMLCYVDSREGIA